MTFVVLNSAPDFGFIAYCDDNDDDDDDDDDEEEDDDCGAEFSTRFKTYCLLWWCCVGDDDDDDDDGGELSARFKIIIYFCWRLNNYFPGYFTACKV